MSISQKNNKNFNKKKINNIFKCTFVFYKKIGEPNVSYICSRYYRAPELIFDATEYTN